MAINKVIYQGETLMDVTDSTVSPDTLGNGVVAYAANGTRIVGTGISGVGGGIIDVIELPTENINTQVFYRLLTAKIIMGQSDLSDYDFLCYCVNDLPATGLPATNADMSILNAYYNTQDGSVMGYIDNTLSAGLGVSVGWYDIATLLTVANQTFGGVITDINDDPCDDAIRVLLGYDFYVYQDEWCKTVFGYEKGSKIDVRWDGVIGDKFALDMSALGFEGIQLVKVSDESLTIEQLIGSKGFHEGMTSGDFDITESDIDTSTYPGGITVNNGEIVSIYSADEANAALGLPAGYLTNGLYFFNNTIDEFYVSRLVVPSRIIKIDSKYIDIPSQPIYADDVIGLAPVAMTGSYNDLSHTPEIYTDVIRYMTYQNLGENVKQIARLNIGVYSQQEVDAKIANAGTSVDLSDYAKTADVETMIAEAIGNAIGGSY